MMHCVRLLMTAKEFGLTGKMTVDRTADRDLLLSIKHHEWEYEDILSLARTLREEAILAIEGSSLPDVTDTSLLEDILRSVREKVYFPK